MSHNDIQLNLFPNTSPYCEAISDDPPFDPDRHLALEKPEFTISLAELGYESEVLATTGSEIAASSCFRILSDEGVAVMHRVCKQLEAFTTSNPRIERNTRGGVYRSHFLRDFSLSIEVADHLSSILKTPLRPIAMGHQLAHLNYAPKAAGENVDKWHYDTLQVDTVMFVTDPNAVSGGEFQYFRGTRDEMAAIKERGESIPETRIISPEMPGPGYAVLMQGNYVVHRAKGLSKPGERITLVNGYSYADMSIDDYTAVDQLIFAEPEETVGAEYSRHVALRCARQMMQLVNEPDFSLDLSAHAKQLSRIRDELNQAIRQLDSAKQGEMRHFGD
jgi:hypothetical protein